MPELVADGPVIPVQLLNELDSGSAVFFCGAGISMGPESDLPSFGGLVEHVYAANHLDPDQIEAEALDRSELDFSRRRPNLDKALGLLERPSRLGSHILRQTIADRISKPPIDELITHKALIALSRSTGEGLRLVTTNFDNRFTEAGCNERLIDESPKLPIPKLHTWSSLVHLHGRVVSGSGQNLILTAADFGRAYLTEGWAARFITELFRQFTVIFVGYSLDDPVMSYMVDALAAERAKGIAFATAYAFAEYTGDISNRKHTHNAWLAKNVEPILYNSRDSHKLLRHTLVEWARIKADPFQARKNIAVEEISKFPSSLADPAVQRVTWALESPVAAKALADAPPTIDFADFPKLAAWLAVFAEAGLLSRRSSDATQNHMHLVGTGSGTSGPQAVDAVTFHLARWIAKHLHVPEVLAWTLKNGGHVHPTLKHEIYRNLANPHIEIPARLRSLWTVITTDESLETWDTLWIGDQLKKVSEITERILLRDSNLKKHEAATYSASGRTVTY